MHVSGWCRAGRQAGIKTMESSKQNIHTYMYSTYVGRHWLRRNKQKPVSPRTIASSSLGRAVLADTTPHQRLAQLLSITPSHGHHKKILYCVTCFHDQSSITSCVSSICNEMKHKHSGRYVTGSKFHTCADQHQSIHCRPLRLLSLDLKPSFLHKSINPCIQSSTKPTS